MKISENLKFLKAINSHTKYHMVCSNSQVLTVVRENFVLKCAIVHETQTHFKNTTQFFQKFFDKGTFWLPMVRKCIFFRKKPFEKVRSSPGARYLDLLPISYEGTQRFLIF